MTATLMRAFVATAASRPVDCDVEQRLLRGAVFATTGLASDGWIILPRGMALEQYARDPIVTRRHLTYGEPVGGEGPLVIGRAAQLAPTDVDLAADVQFADTEDGRDFAYLYGVNQSKTPFMRGWSVEGNVLERRTITPNEARVLSGPYWHEELAARFQGEVQVAMRFDLRSVAAVAQGADRSALTRAAREGCGAAWGIIARMDFETAQGELAEVKGLAAETAKRVEGIEKEIRALRGEGASAAARGDSEAILQAIRDLRAVVAAGRR